MVDLSSNINTTPFERLKGWAWQCMPLILALARQEQVISEFQAYLVYKASSRTAGATQGNPISGGKKRGEREGRRGGERRKGGRERKEERGGREGGRGGGRREKPSHRPCLTHQLHSMERSECTSTRLSSGFCLMNWRVPLVKLS